MCPQSKHRLELGNHRSILINVRPYHSDLYSSCLTNSDQLASLIERARFRFLTKFFRAKSSTAMAQVFTDQPSCQLVKKILACITNLLVYPSYFQTRFVSIFRPFLFPIQRLLCSTQFGLFRLNSFGIGDFFARTQSDQTCNT